MTLPAYGGDTVWANTATAYESLPVPLQRLADQLRVVHTNRYDYVRPSTFEGARERDHYAQFVSPA